MITRVDYVPRGAINRPGQLLVRERPSFITVHETGNQRRGMGAEQHRRFVHAGGGEHNVSFHWVLDDREAWHLIPDNEKAWHAGDGANGPGNSMSLGVEHCVNEDADWMRMAWNGIHLVGTLCFLHGLDASAVVRHSHWRSTECPAWLTGTGLWDWYVDNVKGYIAALRGGHA